MTSEGLRHVRMPNNWTPGYFAPLVGLRMPALIERGRVLEGELVSYVESARRIDLYFADVAPEEVEE